MFLYEMQRQTDQERLFHGKLFHLARSDSLGDARHTKFDELEQHVLALEKQLRTEDVQDRIATNKARMDAQQAKINEQSGRINSHDESLGNLQQRLDDLITESNLYNRQVARHENTIKTQGYTLADLEGKVGKLRPGNNSSDAELAAVRGKIEQLQRNDDQAFSILGYHTTTIQAAIEGTEAIKAALTALESKNTTIEESKSAIVKADIDNLELSLKLLNDDVADLIPDFKALKAEHDTTAGTITEMKTNCASLQSTVEALTSSIIDLAADRDLLMTRLSTADSRIDKLEGTVRALTGQLTSPITRASTPSLAPHKLAVRVADGEPYELAVPKGYGRKGESDKENGRSIRTFVPGKPWKQDGGEGSGSERSQA